ncbi:MAG: hypothetical protein KGV44_03260 [Flavobacteriaceae bacterium]|nr:hypothetical protein [Flavobacteriaceae bacterium]
MARLELSDEQMEQLKNLGQKKEYSNEEIKNFKHRLKNYNEGTFGDDLVVIITLLNKLGERKYIVPKQSQLSMRTQYYWINGINQYLEEGLLQERLVVIEDFEELFIDGELYLVHKELI